MTELAVEPHLQPQQQQAAAAQQQQQSPPNPNDILSTTEERTSLVADPLTNSLVSMHDPVPVSDATATNTSLPVNDHTNHPHHALQGDTHTTTPPHVDADSNDAACAEALDSILETSVADVDAALKDEMDAVAQAVGHQHHEEQQQQQQQLMAVQELQRQQQQHQQQQQHSLVVEGAAVVSAAANQVGSLPDSSTAPVAASSQKWQLSLDNEPNVVVVPSTGSSIMNNNGSNATNHATTAEKPSTATITTTVVEQQGALQKNLHMNAAAMWVPPSKVNAQGQRVGRWSLDEKLLFLYGLQKFGKGRWKKISTYVPDRSLVQIKSHAQKVLKRMDSGENVFGRLEENVGRLHLLVSQMHERLGMEPPTSVLQPAPMLLQQPTPQQQLNHTIAVSNNNNSVGSNKRKRKTAGGTEHILAASALCQLAGPEDGSSSNNSIAGGAAEGSAATAVVAAVPGMEQPATGGTETIVAGLGPPLNEDLSALVDATTTGTAGVAGDDAIAAAEWADV